jgi:CheY-like chemotaxis protein
MNNASTHRLLLIDDDPLQLKLYKLALENEGFQVVTARDGREGLDIATQIPLEGVVSDILMPNVDGFRLCQTLKKDPPFAELPVVLLSAAYTEPEDYRLAKDVRASALITRISDMRWMMDRILDGLKTPPLPGPVHPEAHMTYQHRLIRQLERQTIAVRNNAQQAENLKLQMEEMRRTFHKSHEWRLDP